MPRTFKPSFTSAACLSYCAIYEMGSSVSWEQMVDMEAGPTQDGGRFNARETRGELLENESFRQDAIRRYALYPFDQRWAYHSNFRPLWNEPRPALAAQCWPGNTLIVTRMFAERPDEHVPMFVTNALPDYHLLRPNGVGIPIRLRPGEASAGASHRQQTDFLGRLDTSTQAQQEIANLSVRARDYLKSVGITKPDADANEAGLIWFHSLAIAYATKYLTDNADGVRQDWPRIPLPKSNDRLLTSAMFGKNLAALLDPEAQVPGVTQGKVKPELKVIAEVVSIGNLDFNVTAGWGHPGQDGVTMPGKGKVIVRDNTESERNAFGAAISSIGSSTCDVFLNESTYWRNIPVPVWEYTIGGYQIIKKWLSYREANLFGRALRADEVREVTNIARRITAILLMGPELDGNYDAVKSETFKWAQT